MSRAYPIPSPAKQGRARRPVGDRDGGAAIAEDIVDPGAQAPLHVAVGFAIWGAKIQPLAGASRADFRHVGGKVVKRQPFPVSPMHFAQARVQRQRFRVGAQQQRGIAGAHQRACHPAETSEFIRHAPARHGAPPRVRYRNITRSLNATFRIPRRFAVADKDDGQRRAGHDYFRRTSTGAWSDGCSQPRTLRKISASRTRGASAGVTQTWSRRRPLSAASQSAAR